MKYNIILSAPLYDYQRRSEYVFTITTHNEYAEFMRAVRDRAFYQEKTAFGYRLHNLQLIEYIGIEEINDAKDA